MTTFDVDDISTICAPYRQEDIPILVLVLLASGVLDIVGLANVNKHWVDLGVNGEINNINGYLYVVDGHMWFFGSFLGF